MVPSGRVLIVTQPIKQPYILGMEDKRLVPTEGGEAIPIRPMLSLNGSGSSATRANTHTNTSNTGSQLNGKSHNQSMASTARRSRTPGYNNQHNNTNDTHSLATTS